MNIPYNREKKHICSNCLSFIEDENICSAFPYGIPREILSGEKTHDTILAEQDAPVTYVPKDEGLECPLVL